MKTNTKTLAAAALAAAATLAMTAQSQAAFTVSISNGVVSGADTIYNVSALNTGNGTGTALNLIDTTLTALNNAFIFNLTDIDGDGAVDANVLGTGLNAGNASSPSVTAANLTTYQRPGRTTSIATTVMDPSPTQTDPNGTGAPTQAINAEYTNGTVTSFHIQSATLGTGLNASVTPVVFAHVAVPTGTLFTVSGNLGGDMGNLFTFATVGNVATTPTPTPTPTTTPIISLTTTAPTAFGSQVGTLTLTGNGNGSYNVATAAFTAVNTGYVAVTGFNPGTDREVYGLDVLEGGATPNAADLATIVADINATAGNTDTNGTVTASLVAGSAFASLFPADDILLTTAGTTSGSPFLGFNVAGITGLTGTGVLTVNTISAVPEPTSLAVLGLGVTGLLAGRRRNKRAM